MGGIIYNHSGIAATKNVSHKATEAQIFLFFLTGFKGPNEMPPS
jgi:hypothetical protein